MVAFVGESVDRMANSPEDSIPLVMGNRVTSMQRTRPSSGMLHNRLVDDERCGTKSISRHRVEIQVSSFKLQGLGH